MNVDYDVITMGGGLGGAALAKILAENGKRVLVVERETTFKDRVRGEWIAPWGVAEAQTLGLYEPLLNRCAHVTPRWNDVMQPLRDFRTTTPQRLPTLTLYHPAMQETVLDSARDVGAEVWRGATISGLQAGDPPVVSILQDGRVIELTARLVVCADGRNSAARSLAGFATKRGSQKLMGAGLLLENLSVPEDASHVMLNPFDVRWALLIPQGGGRGRAYLFYGTDLERLQGERDTTRFMDECIKAGMPAEMYAGARPAGPLASFDMTETWVDHPYHDGLVLIGDAAGASDPSWGQGLSLTLRDARVLAEKLLSTDDWPAAAHSYASAHDAYFNVERIVGQWAFDLLFARDSGADKLREQALPMLLAEPDRFPDHFFSGPELPCNDDVRKRFFGET
jgi:menaquinone-9 beta-reductase